MCVLNPRENHRSIIYFTAIATIGKTIWKHYEIKRERALLKLIWMQLYNGRVLPVFIRSWPILYTAKTPQPTECSDFRIAGSCELFIRACLSDFDGAPKKSIYGTDYKCHYGLSHSRSGHGCIYAPSSAPHPSGFHKTKVMPGSTALYLWIRD